MHTAGQHTHTHTHTHTTPTEKWEYNQDTREPCEARDCSFLKRGSFSHLLAEKFTKKQTRFRVHAHCAAATPSLYRRVSKKKKKENLRTPRRKKDYRTCGNVLHASASTRAGGLQPLLITGWWDGGAEQTWENCVPFTLEVADIKNGWMQECMWVRGGYGRQDCNDALQTDLNHTCCFRLETHISAVDSAS